MKKSIIALVALAAMTAQADNTTLYGNVSAEYQFFDKAEHKVNGHVIEKNGSHSSLAPSGKIGIKSSEDLGNGMKAFLKYEGGIETAGGLKTKKAYVGLSGNFGSVTAGKQALPVDDLGNYSDPFNSLTPGADDGIEVPTSTNAGLVYAAPEMYGLKAKVGVEADGRGGHHNHIDTYSAAVSYDANGIFAGVGYTHLNDHYDSDAYHIGLGYGNDQYEIGTYTDYVMIDGDDNDVAFTRLSALYNVTPSDAVYAGASVAYEDNDGTKVNGKKVDKLSNWDTAVGYQHNFSKRTKMWTEYQFSEDDDDVASNLLSIGLKSKF